MNIRKRVALSEPWTVSFQRSARHPATSLRWETRAATPATAALTYASGWPAVRRHSADNAFRQNHLD